MEPNESMNIFTKGIVDDLDPLMVDAAQWVFPTLNIRIMNKQGQGVICTFIEGNKAEFSLTPGFLAIGSCQYNGVCYIISHNAISGEGEIGCYPSPVDLDYNQPHITIPPTNPIFERKYRPLLNYINGTNTPVPLTDTRIPLRATAFNFDLEHQVSVFPKESYDGSVDLYLADYKNVNRVVNSGFNQEGRYLDRLYFVNDFYSSMNQIQISGTIMTVNLNSIEAGGQLTCGIYFANFRYCDVNHNATHVIAVSNACQVFDGEVTQLNAVEGGQANQNSNKKIIFDLTNVDTSYTFINVILTKWYSTVDGVMLHESFLIDTDYEIGGTSTMQITITGEETMIPFEESQLLAGPSQLMEFCCRDHIQINNRYYGCNWKGIQKHHKALENFAQQITINYNDTLTKPAGHTNEYTPNLDLGQYTDYFFTYDHVGYFRGEGYPFGIQYELIDGSITDIYPTQGCDGYNLDKFAIDNAYIIGDVNHNLVNNQGIFRFPRQEYSPAFVNNNIKILGVKFNNTDAIAWLGGAGTPAEVQWFLNNVRAIYYVRGERKETLKSQGITMNVCYPHIDSSQEFNITDECTMNSNAYHSGQEWNDGVYSAYGVNGSENGSHYLGQYSGKFVGVTGATQDWITNFWCAQAIQNDLGYWNNENTHAELCTWKPSEKFFPVYRGYMPMMYIRKYYSDHRYYQSRWFLIKNKYAYYSPDIILNSSYDIDTFEYVKRVAKTFTKWNGADCWSHEYPSLSPIDLRPYITFAEVEGSYIVNVDRPISKINNAIKVGLPYTHDPSNTPTNYCNHFTDIRTGDPDGYTTCGFYIVKRQYQSNEQQWCNRDVLTAPYIALEISDDNDNINLSGHNYNLDIVNIYDRNIDNIGQWPLLGLFGITPNGSGGFNLNTTILYSRISKAIMIDRLDINFGLDGLDGIGPLELKKLVLYKGDCFLQKFYFKQLSWDHSDFAAGGGTNLDHGITDSGTDVDFVGPAGVVWDKPGGNSDDDDKIRYTHGLVLGVVIESKINPAMRNDGIDNSTTFFPHTSKGKSWAFYPQFKAGQECFSYNYGYHRQLDLNTFVRYNPYLPNIAKIHKTRIRHTPLNIPYAYTDAYRVLNPGDFKDYDLQYGQMMALLNIHGKLVSVQEGVINEHFFDQDQIKTSDTPGDLILGLGPILSQSVRNLSDYGSQHQWSINKKGYGVDWKKRVIWGLGIASNDSGSTYATVTNLSQALLIERWVHELFDSYDAFTDILNVFPDTPVNGKGIVTGYDDKYHDIIFTFLMNRISGWLLRPLRGSDEMITMIIDNGGIMDDHSVWIDSLPYYEYQPGITYPLGCIIWDSANGIIYYNDIDGTVPIGKLPCWIHATPVYEDLSRSLVYNIDRRVFIGEYSFTPNIYLNINKDFFSNSGSIIYRHNDADPNNITNFYGTKYKGIISYIVNGGQRYSDIEKIFTNHFIESNDNPFSRILYETAWQQSIHNGDAPDDFRTVQFWRNPEYNVRRWEIPIFVQTSGTDNVFNQESDMRGAWLKVTVEYLKTVPQQIVKTVTKFIIGKNS